MYIQCMHVFNVASFSNASQRLMHCQHTTHASLVALPASQLRSRATRSRRRPRRRRRLRPTTPSQLSAHPIRSLASRCHPRRRAALPGRLTPSNCLRSGDELRGGAHRPRLIHCNAARGCRPHRDLHARRRWPHCRQRTRRPPSVLRRHSCGSGSASVGLGRRPRAELEHLRSGSAGWPLPRRRRLNPLRRLRPTAPTCWVCSCRILRLPCQDLVPLQLNRTLAFPRMRERRRPNLLHRRSRPRHHLRLRVPTTNCRSQRSSSRRLCRHRRRCNIRMRRLRFHHRLRPRRRRCHPPRRCPGRTSTFLSETSLGIMLWCGLRVYLRAVISARRRHPILPAKLIILNTKFIILFSKFIILNKNSSF